VFAIENRRILITGNHRDFLLLHELVLKSGGHHPGILVVRRDNDPRRDMSPRWIVTALRKLLQAAVPMPDTLHVLNQWR